MQDVLAPGGGRCGCQLEDGSTSDRPAAAGVSSATERRTVDIPACKYNSALFRVAVAVDALEVVEDVFQPRAGSSWREFIDDTVVIFATSSCGADEIACGIESDAALGSQASAGVRIE